MVPASRVACCRDSGSAGHGYRRFAVRRRRRIWRRAVECFADLPATMDQFEQVEHGGFALNLTRCRVDGFVLAHQCQAGGLLPGSSLMRSGCSAQSLCVRSTRRITNGRTRCTRARSRASNNLARFSLHGINGLPLRSRTKTATLILSSTTTGGRPARVIRYCLSPPGDCPYGPCNGSLAAPLPSAMLRSSFGSRLAVARFVPPSGLSAATACRAAN